ncbi:hypothetical protein HK096_005495, partial [Nowakowskiella sp. JEL0078]
NSRLTEVYDQLRRYRGSPAKAAENFFTPDASVTFVSTGSSYVGISQIEQLLSTLRDTFHLVNVKKISLIASESIQSISGMVTEECIYNIKHDSYIPWLAPDVRETGEELQLPVCIITSIQNGKIRSQRLYWDHLTVLRSFKAVSRATKGVANLPEPNDFAKRVVANVNESLISTEIETYEDVEELQNQGGPPKPQRFPTTGTGRTSTRVGGPPGGRSNFSFA